MDRSNAQYASSFIVDDISRNGPANTDRRDFHEDTTGATFINWHVTEMLVVLLR